MTENEKRKLRNQLKDLINRAKEEHEQYAKSVGRSTTDTVAFRLGYLEQGIENIIWEELI